MISDNLKKLTTKKNRHLLLTISTILFVMTVVSLIYAEWIETWLLARYGSIIIDLLVVSSIFFKVTALILLIFMGFKIPYKTPAVIISFFVTISTITSINELFHDLFVQRITGFEEAITMAVSGILLLMTGLILYPLLVEFFENKEKLKSFNGILLSMLENVPFDFWARDLNGIQFVQSNEGKKMWGVLKDQTLSEQFIDPLTRRLWEENNRKAYSGVITKGERNYLGALNGEERTYFEVVAPYYIDNTVAGIMGINFDITEQKQNEKQIAIQSSALNAAANGIVITDIHAGILWVNRAFETMTGYELAEIRGMNVSELLRSGVHTEEFYQDLWGTITSGKPWTGEMVNRRKDGTTYIEEQTITPVFDDAGTLVRYVGIKQDITERKKNEKKILQNEQNFKLYLSSAPYGIFIVDATGRYSEVNPAGCTMMGYTEDEMLMMSVPNIIAPSSVERGIKHFTDLQTKGRADDEIELRRKDGSIFMSRIIAVSLPDGRAIGFTEDVSEKKRTEQQKIEHQRNLETIISNLPGYIYRAKDSGEVSELLFVSEGAMHLTGFSMSELYGSGMNQLITSIPAVDRKRCWAITNDALLNKKSFEIEYPVITKEKNWLWLWERGKGVYDEQGNYLYTEGYVFDITDRKNAQRKSRTLENQMKAFYDQSEIGMVIADLDGSFRRVNSGFCELLGYQESELLKLTYKDITHPDDIQQDAEQVQELLSNGSGSFALEKRYISKSGTTVWVNITVTLIKDSDENPQYFATLIENITERIRIQTAIENLAVTSGDSDRDSTFVLIVKNLSNALSADCVFVGMINPDGTTVTTSACMMNGKIVDNFTYPLPGSPCANVLKRGSMYHATGIVQLYPEDIALAGMGMDSYLGTTLFSSQGKPIGILVAMAQRPLDEVSQFTVIHSVFAQRCANEIERIAAEEELQKRENEFRFLVERSQDVVVRLNVFGKILYCSPSIEQFGGYDHTTILGKNVKEFFAHREQMFEAFSRMKESVLTGKSNRFEFEFLMVNGESVWVESVGKAVTFADGSIELQTILREISERKKSEEVLKQYKEIISATFDSISLVDDTFRYLVVNDAYLNRMAKTRDEIEGHSIAEVFGEEIFAKTIKANFERCLAGNEVHYQAWFNFAGVGRKFMDVQYSPYNHHSSRGVLVSSRDITALKEAQKLQIESENRFKAVWENSHDAMRLTDADGIIVMANDAYCALMKKPMDELAGRPFTASYPVERNTESLRIYRTRFHTRTVDEYFERDITLWNNETLHIQASNKFLTLPDNEVLLLSVFKDITVRVHALKDLKESEHRYRGIIESSMDGFWTVDYSGKLLQVNEAYCRMSGYSQEELLSMHVSELEANEDPAETDRHMKIIVTHGRDKFESKHRAKDGTMFDVEISTVVLTELQVLVVFISDITERKSSELALKESERRFRGILEDVTLISIILDSKGSIAMANNFLLNLTGYAREDVLGRSWFDVFIPDEIRSDVRTIFDGAIDRNDLPQHYENEILKRSGERLIIRWTNIMLYDNSKNFIGVTSIGEDITERRRIQSALRDREEQYRTLITTMQQGMALHEIILSPEGIPIDYRFIDVNESFEHLTGLKASEIIGRTVLEVMPETEQYWIEQYGAVALTGAPLFYENYSKVLGKYFEVIAYRPKQNHFATIVSEITQRKLSEQKVLDNERQYRLLAENSTDVIWTMDFDGHFIYVSPSVFRLRGFTSAEVMAQTMEEVICPSSINLVVTGLLRTREFASKGLDIPNEYYLVEQPRKDGTTVWTEVITRIMYDDQRKALGILGVTRDITERKRNEDLLKARLLLSEYANDHTVKELLQKILDEAENISESTIGFFHFVEDDQKTISLQTWSTNTLKNMCHAEGDGRHYPVDKAGVWVECIYTKAPVIHNIFSEVPNQKGLPEGHAPVVRELLIPILRNDLVVGIMGVGNKLYNYDSKDVELVSQLATMAWDILERRRAELSLLSHEQALEGLTNAAVSLLNMSEQNQQIMIWAALESLGKGLNADRIVIFENSYNSHNRVENSSLKHEWVNDPLNTLIDDPKMQEANFEMILPAMYRTLNDGKIFSGIVNELPDEERSIFHGNKVKSIISIPIFIESRFWGSLCVDSINEARHWTKDDESILRVAAESIGVALHRMNAITNLYESEQMLKFALDASGDGIWTYSIPTNEVYFSPETKKLVGFEHIDSENNMEFWMEHVHPDDRQKSMEAMERHLRGEDTIFINEHRFLCGNGEYRWMLDRGKILRWNKDGSPLQIFGTYSDIHDRKMIEQKIVELNEQLEEKVEERTRQLRESMQELESFSYSISHDLRAPVRAIDSFAKILADEEELHIGEEGKRLLKTIRTNTSRMGRMIDDLLQFSRTSRAEIKKVHCDMHSLAEKVLEEVLLGEKHRTFETVIQPLPAANGDPSLLRQVLVNLVSNAVKFSRGREVSKIEIGGSITEGQCHYFVKDNGTGFDMRYVDKLFGVFQRLHAQSEFEGTGVGLAIVNRVLQKHAGKIWVESELNVGTTFYFSIPIASE
ncbi:MAG: PAS domain S-box protein [Bacteroidota bacterium]